MSRSVISTIQEKTKLYIAIFALLGLLLNGFNIMEVEEIAFTRMIIIIYIGLLMLAAYVADMKRPTRTAEIVKDQLNLLMMDLQKFFQADGMTEKEILIRDLEAKLAVMKGVSEVIANG